MTNNTFQYALDAPLLTRDTYNTLIMCIIPNYGQYEHPEKCVSTEKMTKTLVNCWLNICLEPYTQTAPKGGYSVTQIKGAEVSFPDKT